MKYELKKGNSSNYEIIITLTEQDFADLKDKVLKNFQKDLEIKGFRKGHVPLSMVEQNIRPEYMKIGLYEEAVNGGLDLVIKENPDIKFIGQIYDLNQKEEKNNVTISFKLDEYPEPEVLNQNWTKFDFQPIDDEPTQEDIDQAINNLKMQYAEYKEGEKVGEESIFKTRFDYMDKDGNAIDKGSAIFGPEDFAEFPKLKDIFLSKAKDDKIEVEYKKDLPALLLYQKDKGTPKKVVIEIMDIRDRVLPEFNAENLTKFFGNEGIKTQKDLEDRVVVLIKDQKRKTLLIKVIEDFIKNGAGSVKIAIPKTIYDEEYKTRIKSLEQRFGGEAKLNEYYEKIGEDQKSKMLEEIKSSSKESLEKFFVFRKLVELLGIEADVDWSKEMEAEEKVYAKLLEMNSGEKKTKKSK